MKARRDFWKRGKNNLLTPNFKATEFFCNDGSACPIVARPAMIELCLIYLEPMRAKFGTCLVLSGYRHVLYNAEIGGVKQSQHIWENSFESVAADVTFQNGTPRQWAAEARKLRAAKNEGNGGVGEYRVLGFIHVDNRAYKADWSG